MFVKVIYVRCRAQPTLHHCVVIWAGEGVRYVCEAIGERLISSFVFDDVCVHVCVNGEVCLPLECL